MVGPVGLCILLARGFPLPSLLSLLVASPSDVGLGAGAALLSQQIRAEVTEGRAWKGLCWVFAKLGLNSSMFPKGSALP